MLIISNRIQWKPLLSILVLGAALMAIFGDDARVAANSQVRRLEVTQNSKVSQGAQPNDIGYIHLGKCHGLGLKETLLRVKEGIIGRRGIHWYHMLAPDVDMHHDFIALVRDPVDRTISNFLFEHPKNAPYRKNGMAVTLPYVHKLELYDCYDTIDALTTDGLGGNKNEKCPHLAMNLFQGSQSSLLHGLPHFVYKFDFYYEKLLNQSDSKTIYVVRNENMIYDLNKINRLTGGSGNPYSTVIDLPHWKLGVDSKNLPAKEKSLSPQGLQNLCRALCSEIQVYKQLLVVGLNINKTDREMAMTKLKEKCPEEASLTKCPQQEKLTYKFEKKKK